MTPEPPQTHETLVELKERLARGEYVIDPLAVADSLLRRAPDLAWLLGAR